MVAMVAPALSLACTSAQPLATPDPTRILIVEANGNVVRQSTNDENSRLTFSAPFARVWTALVQTYAELGISVNVDDRPTGRFGNVGFLAPRRIMNRPLGAFYQCGSGLTGPLIDNGRLTADIVTSLTSQPDGTTSAITHVGGFLRKNEGSSSDAIRCASTGAVEEYIRTSVEAKLKATP